MRSADWNLAPATGENREYSKTTCVASWLNRNSARFNPDWGCGCVWMFQPPDDAAAAAQSAVMDIYMHTHLLPYQRRLETDIRLFLRGCERKQQFLEASLIWHTSTYGSLVWRVLQTYIRQSESRALDEDNSPLPQWRPQQGPLFIGAERRLTLSSMAAVCCPLLDTRTFKMYSNLLKEILSVCPFLTHEVKFSHWYPYVLSLRFSFSDKNNDSNSIGKSCIQYFTLFNISLNSKTRLAHYYQSNINKKPLMEKSADIKAVFLKIKQAHDSLVPNYTTTQANVNHNRVRLVQLASVIFLLLQLTLPQRVQDRFWSSGTGWKIH